MVLSKAVILLNLVRMIIIQSLVKCALTSQELQKMLPEIPQATPYQLLKVLSAHQVTIIPEGKS